MSDNEHHPAKFVVNLVVILVGVDLYVLGRYQDVAQIQELPSSHEVAQPGDRNEPQSMRVPGEVEV